MRKYHLVKYSLILILSVLSLRLNSQQFVEQTNILLPGVSNSTLAWGDYDNDGNLDILLTGASSSGMVSKIFRNNANNSFTEQTNIVLKGVHKSSGGWGDYDRDGDLDILLAGNTGQIPFVPITKIYRNNGNNSFIEQTDIILPGVEDCSVEWCDFDNDGDLDIIMSGTSISGLISKIYRNDGINNFSELIGFSLNEVHFSSLACGDYDNDGYWDILITGQNSNGQNISKIYRNNGCGSFIEQSTINLLGVKRGSVAWGDYDNDGYIDILLAGSSNNGFVSKIYRNIGNNSFAEQTSIDLTGIWYGSVAWGDYDGDGFLDVLLTGQKLTENNTRMPISKVYRNNRDNSFSEQTTIVLDQVDESSVAWGDYDNDGDLDILLAGYDSLSQMVTKVYRNELQNQLSPPIVPSGLQSYWENDNIIFRWGKSLDNSTPRNSINYNLRIGVSSGGNELKPSHAQQDGKLLLPNISNILNDTCIKLKLPIAKYFWSVQAIDKGGLASSFSPEAITPLDSIQAKKLQAYIRSSNSILIRWENGNGIRRALFGRISRSIGTANPINGTIYHAESYFAQGDEIGSSGWYCLYDGRADSAMIYGLGIGSSYDFQVIEYILSDGLPIYFNSIGNANPGVFSSTLFTAQTDIEFSGTGASFISCADYDNDGYIDILLASSPYSTIYRNNGDNSFSEQIQIILDEALAGSAAWGDYDNDNDLDIIITGCNPNSVPFTKIYLNNSDNTFSEQTNITLQEVFHSSVSWGDYNNDSYLDVLLTGAIEGYPNFSPTSKIYCNNGDNSFTEQTNINLTGVAFGSSTWLDYDNDGDLDILLTGSSSGYGINPVSKIYRNNGNNSFIEQTGIDLAGVFASSVAIGDYNNDDFLDILLTGQNGSGQNISKIYRNNGDNSFTDQSGIILTGVDTGSASWGDYDNDGDLDILLTGLSHGVEISKIYRNDGNNIFTEQTNIPIAGVAGSSVSFCDYDNDGDLDIAFLGVLNQVSISKIYRNNTIMRAGDFFANIKPKSPINLSNFATPNGIMLYWSPVRTDISSYKAMSYNVRVSTNRDSTNICPVHANLEDGYRRIVAMGNAQLDTTFLLKNLPSNNYYWSVQAVDQGYLGSEWSLIDSFEVKTTQAFFYADSVCQGLPTTFMDQSKSDDLITSWQWDFGDGSTSDMQHPSHIYSISGRYNVKLVVASNNYTDSTTLEVVVKPSPKAEFIADPVCHGFSTIFQNLSLVSDLFITSWEWDLGDGQSFLEKVPPPHFYPKPGDYTVKLLATYDNGCSDTISKIVNVGEYPVALLSASGPTEFCTGGNVLLSVGKNNNYSYQWKLNDLAITDSISDKLTVIYSGEYSVEVNNKIANCVSSSQKATVTVIEKPVRPVIKSISSVSGICPGDQNIDIEVEQSTSTYSYQWKLNGVPIDDANSSKLTKIVKPGNYSVMATIKSCAVESEPLVIKFLDAYEKPEVIAKGPTVWYLMCSNDSVRNINWYYNGNLIQEAKNKALYVANQKIGQYYVELISEDGCKTKSDIITIPIGVTGIEDTDPFTGLKIYPNPTPGLFTIEMDNNIFGDLLIDILNQTGSKVLNIKFDKTTEYFMTQIDLSGQSKGMYIINLAIKEYKASRKLVVE